MIDIEQTGIVLHAECYDACVAFYRDGVGLPVVIEKAEPGQMLTLLAFGGAYLMLEYGGVAHDGRKTAFENPVTIRFNVADVETSADLLRQRGIDVAVSRFEWGAIGDFQDPDGNRCQLREASSFAK